VTPTPSTTNLQAMFSRPSIVATSDTAPAPSIAVAAVAAAAEAKPEADGAMVHCVSVNVMVFKHGRITVPPALVFAGEGLGTTPEQGIQARECALKLGLRGMRELYRGGWRAVPEGGERWWDEAMDGLEERIERRVGKVMGVREGVDGALVVKDI
jgi:hypothetical protein